MNTYQARTSQPVRDVGPESYYGLGISNFVERVDGQILLGYVYAPMNSDYAYLYLSTVPTMDDLKANGEQLIKQNEWQFIKLGTNWADYPVSFSRLGNGIVMTTLTTGSYTAGENKQSLDCYYSANGLGTDFVKVGTVYEYNLNLTDPGSDGGQWATKVTVLPSGRIVAIHGHYYYGIMYSTTYDDNYGDICTVAVSVSDDNGATWQNKLTMDYKNEAGLNLHEYNLLEPSVGVLNGGELIASTFKATRMSDGSINYYTIESRDQGETWQVKKNPADAGGQTVMCYFGDSDLYCVYQEQTGEIQGAGAELRSIKKRTTSWPETSLPFSDGAWVGVKTGQEWHVAAYTLPAGTSQVTVQYAKDSSVGDSYDAAFVDEILIDGPTVIDEKFDDNNFVLNITGDWIYTTTHVFNGNQSYMSTAVDGETSKFSFPVDEPGESTLYVVYSYGTESGYDIFSILVNGVEIIAKSGSATLSERGFPQVYNDELYYMNKDYQVMSLEYWNPLPVADPGPTSLGKVLPRVRRVPDRRPLYVEGVER